MPNLNHGELCLILNQAKIYKMFCALCTIFSGKMLASCMKNVQNFNFPTPGVQRSDCCDQLVLHC